MGANTSRPPQRRHPRRSADTPADARAEPDAGADPDADIVLSENGLKDPATSPANIAARLIT
jgi:hypothetical protein